MTRLTQLSLACLVACALSSAAAQAPPCRIDIVDSENGWPVPLVELRTNHHVRFVSDNAGVIAFDLPELMGEETWFTVEGHGYGVKADGFGMRGVRLVPEPGGHLEVEVDREVVAKRLGRLTGAGLFGESQRFGLHADWRDQGILGCDSVQNAVHRGRLFWNWGDTTLARYPLGLFHMLGATTEPMPMDSFEPPVRLRFDYFAGEDGRPRVVAEMPGPGPTWLNSYASLPDKDGQHHLVATYAKIEPPLSVYEIGFCIWDDETARFKKHRVHWSKEEDGPDRPPYPDGHATFWTDGQGDDWVLFGDPYPALRCRATFEAWDNPDAWEVLERQETVEARDSGKELKVHRGSIAWNAFRGRWVSVFTQLEGDPSMLGEIWYAEADAPTGPWGPAVKVLSHNRYTFYNPRLHQEFTAPDSPVLLFEGTYTNQFSGTQSATPRYDYNQILYRLDLDGPAFADLADR